MILNLMVHYQPVDQTLAALMGALGGDAKKDLGPPGSDTSRSPLVHTAARSKRQFDEMNDKPDKSRANSSN